METAKRQDCVARGEFAGMRVCEWRVCVGASGDLQLWREWE